MSHVQQLYDRWQNLLGDNGKAASEAFDATATELRNQLKSVEWDLEDLTQTINILTVLLVFFLCVWKGEKGKVRA